MAAVKNQVFKWLGRALGDKEIGEPQDPSFQAFAAQVNVNAGYFALFIALGASLLFWPTDATFFAGRPEMITAFAWVRAGFSALATLGLFLLRGQAKRRAKGKTGNAYLATIEGLLCVLASLWGGYHLSWCGGFDNPWYYVIYALVCVPCLFAYDLPWRLLVSALSSGGWTVAFLVGRGIEIDRLGFGILNFQVFVTLFAIAWGHRNYVLLRTNWRQAQLLQVQAAALQAERARAERLLANILPADIALRLKDDERGIADGFEHVTVLFADIVGFTLLTTEMNPGALVAILDRIFSGFDELADQHGLEKIKTIGDAYMVAAGLPTARADHAIAMAEMALGMQTVVDTVSAELGRPIQIRIGMNSGPVVAGVIGKRKFIYDLWGDTVNTASRMESLAPEGRIQVTRATFELLSQQYALRANPLMQVKGKGMMESWLLEGRRE
jgi:class 3 adenylate cyclase